MTTLIEGGAHAIEHGLNELGFGLQEGEAGKPKVADRYYIAADHGAPDGDYTVRVVWRLKPDRPRLLAVQRIPPAGLKALEEE